MLNRVDIVVKAKQSGTALITPYSHQEGLQYYRPGPLLAIRVATYRVPAYEVLVGDVTFRAVRFALRNDGNPPQPVRACDTGLSHARVCVPQWIPSYSPHSFRGRARPGAWRLLPGKDFLIHEGPGSEPDATGGSIGCIEILDGKWGHFLWQIEQLAGGTCSAIAASKKLVVTIEAAPYPSATFAP